MDEDNGNIFSRNINLSAHNRNRQDLQRIGNNSEYKLRGVHYNIRSILKNYDQLALTIHNSKIDWDFIALTECWADRQDIENINLSIKGYNQVNCRKKFNQNGGVMVYIREDYKIEELEIENKDLGCEILSVRINKLTNNNMTSTNQGYILNVIYRNPSRSKLTMINGIRELVAKTGSKGNAIYIGDFNIDLKENSQVAEDLKK